MAEGSGRKRSRDIVALMCSECKRRNYTTYKKTKGVTTKLSLKKYCKWCKKHTLHIEKKAK
jgi:large subunit ribosomal protein L33